MVISSFSCSANIKFVDDSYGKPNGAKFKKQNWPHVQQIRYQGQEKFQSSPTKSSHVQHIFYQGQDIQIQGQQNNVLTFNKFPFKGKTYPSQAQEITRATLKEKPLSTSSPAPYQPQTPRHASTTRPLKVKPPMTRRPTQPNLSINNPYTLSTTTPTTVNKVVNPQCNIHCKKRHFPPCPQASLIHISTTRLLIVHLETRSMSTICFQVKP